MARLTSKYNLFSLILSVFLCCICCTALAKPDPQKDILPKIEAIKAPVFAQELQQAGFTEPPTYISLRLYKLDAQLEIWGGYSDTDQLKKIATYPICAMDFAPGPKLKEGDERTPEGSFDLSFYNSSSNWFMHINLDPNKLSDEGDTKDPAFYACTDYPTSFHKNLSKSIGVKKPGSAICIHGNCVSVGCASMQNTNFIEIYYWLKMHDVKQFGAPRAHFLPFRFYEPCGNNYCYTGASKALEQMAQIAATLTPESQLLGPDKIAMMWKHMRNREEAFLTSPTSQTAELELSMDIFNDSQTDLHLTKQNQNLIQQKQTLIQILKRQALILLQQNTNSDYKTKQ